MIREEVISELKYAQAMCEFNPSTGEVGFRNDEDRRQYEAFGMAIEALQAEQLYYFARADQMIGHNFTDDVAITYANTKAEAIKKFSKLYANVTADEVDPVMFNSEDIAILTDY